MKLSRTRLVIAATVALARFEPGFAEDKPLVAPRPKAMSGAAASQAVPKTVEELTALVRKSVVVVTFSGRDGRQMGLGSGFVISPDGLIATNLHVIGEARPISVQAEDGRTFDVTEIHATDRSSDLAIIRVEAQNLTPLELGDSDALRQGEPVLAIGNPRGFRHSVVTGVVSGRPEVDGRPMIQLAMPIEQGNSGGPLIDMHGRVHGLLTLKSLVTDNLGFAVPVNRLKPLLEKPNPVPIARWLTIGALDPARWTPLFGARWRQRAGRIQVMGQGQGFGGRSLVLWTADPPEPPFEFGVQVRLAQEDGAAGLVFHSDGGDRHYGFYPSSGNLRLSRFDGPDVFSWNVLEQVTSEHYRPGEWNAIKVRVEKDRIRCFVNDELAIESTDTRYTSGKVGLAKFRHTEAEFRNFRIAENLPPSRPPAETVKRIRELAAELSLDAAASGELVEKLLPHGDVSGNVLREQARELEQRAERLRELAADIHTRRIHGELQKALKGGDETIDLVRAALLVAALDNEELDVDAYLQTADRMAAAIRETLPPDADAATTLAALDAHLFEQFGYHGSRTNYYDRSNSYLNEVIDDREGLPIMLSILYMELARRLDLNVVGVGLPGHFIVRFEPAEGESQLIDPFDRGARLSREDAAALVAQNTGAKLEEEHLRPQSKREMVLRVLQNLLSVARREQDERGQLRYVDLLVALEPAAAELRAYRADLLMRTRRYAEAIDEVDWFLREKPEGADLARLRELRAALERSLAGEGDE